MRNQLVLILCFNDLKFFENDSTYYKWCYDRIYWKLGKSEPQMGFEPTILRDLVTEIREGRWFESHLGLEFSKFPVDSIVTPFVIYTYHSHVSLTWVVGWPHRRYASVVTARCSYELCCRHFIEESLSNWRFWVTDGNRKWIFRTPGQWSLPGFQANRLY